MIKQILITNTEVPAKRIGSWNHLLSKLLVKKPNFYDVIICPKSETPILGVNLVVKEPKNKFVNLFSKFNKHYKKKTYWNELNKILSSNSDEYIISIFDNLKILEAIHFYACKFGVRNRIKIYFFLRGYRIELNVENRARIYNSIDKLIVQTYHSYINQVKENHSLPCEVNILPNGVDTNIFHPVNHSKKIKLIDENNLPKDKKIFLWVSNDRQKKGLFLILKAWEQISEKYSNVLLIIIGTSNLKTKNSDTVLYIGNLPNQELASFYQLTDYYLFSSLCHEGHPLSLVEALKCGAKCLASDIDPVSEVLDDGRLGYLIKHPHMTNSWVKAIENVLNNNHQFEVVHDLDEIYDIKTWIDGMNKILKK